MDNLLLALWESSTALIRRFNLNPAKSTFMRKISEEYREFEAAYLHGSGDPVEECVDLLVTMVNALDGIGYDLSDIEAAMQRVIEKNDAKTHDTHEVRNGTIERKSKPHKPIDKPVFSDNPTYGELYGDAMEINQEEDAKTYLQGLVEYRQRQNPELTAEAAAEIERGNLGYYSGYYGFDKMEEVNRLFGAVHPVFGSVTSGDKIHGSL